MGSLNRLERRIAVLERKQPQAASWGTVAIVQCTWKELLFGFDPDDVQATLVATPNAVLIVPGALSPDQWDLASRRHHANMFSVGG
jgi:hypothetical protein